MIRTLILIAAVSFVLAVGCIAGAAASIGGPFWIDDTGTIHRIDWRDWHTRHGSDARSPDGGGASQRELTWPGGHRLYVDVPADVTYTQGAQPKLTISGPKDLVDRISVQDGVIEAHDFDDDDARLKITLTAPDVQSFKLSGDETLTISAYDQDQLDVDISGSGKATAQGRAKQADLHISGDGDADFSDLKLDAAHVDVSGSGDTTLAPTALAQIDISGSGNVRLLKAPKSEKINISGSGRVDQPNGG